MSEKLDWRGNPITANESGTDTVLAWVFSPGRSADETIIRDYHEALDYANDLICEKMDEVEEEDLLDGGFTIKVKLVRVTPEYLNELTNEGEL
jgi:hypothetical protein